VERYFAGLTVPGDPDGTPEDEKHFADTVFFGGGTPSFVEPRYIAGVLENIRAAYPLAEDAEITIECNPESLTDEKLEAYRAMGVNRVSIGVQSLDDAVLLRMGRVHDAEKARTAVRMALSAGFNTNCDLIFGAPEQSFGSFRAGLDELLAMGINHVSFYSLQIEEGTPFYIDYRFGSLALPSWEENRRMYHYAVDAVKAAGFRHYEVSNAARPGFECRHNLKYWTMQEYLGIGKAAHSFMGGRRFAGGQPDPDGSTDVNELKTDYIFTELRLTDGFDKNAYFSRFGSTFDKDFGGAAKSLAADGFLALRGDSVAFTPKGLDNTNKVMEKLINALED
jgi:oxygen-independent coproporphyrinogen-3 oxidase